MHPFLALAPMSRVKNLPKLFYLSAAVLLFGAAELAYGAISGSAFFMVFGVPAAILGGLGTILLQEEKKPEKPTAQA